MSRREQAPQAPLTRKQLSRVRREEQQRRYILIGTLVVAIVALGLVLAGALDRTLIRPRQAVARVGDTTITKGEFIKAAKFQRYNLVQNYMQTAQYASLFTDQDSQNYFNQQLQQIAGQLNDPTFLGQQVLNNLVNEQLVRQEAARRGLTASEEEIQAEYQEMFGYFPNGTPTPQPTEPQPTADATLAALLTPAPALTSTPALQSTPIVTGSVAATATVPAAGTLPAGTPAASPPAASPSLTPTATSTAGPSPTPSATFTPRPTATPYTTQGFATQETTFLTNLRQETGLTEKDIRSILEVQILSRKLGEALGAELPTTEEQVHARHILVTDLVTATEVLTQLRNGADFAALAAQYSIDTSNKDKGGDLGWFGRGAMVEPFENAAFSLPVGEYSEPVQSDFGYHIIEVLERGDRELDAEALAAKRDQALTDWLDAQRAVTMPDGRLLVELQSNWVEDVPTSPALPVGF